MSRSVHIRQLTNHCRLLGRDEDLPLVQSEIRQLAESHLPTLLAEEIDRRLPQLATDQGVLHIRALRVRLTVPRSGFSSRSLSRALAEQLAVCLQRHLAGAAHQIKFFSSRAEFNAAFIRDLLEGRAWSTWYYEEFKPLCHFPIAEAAVQMLLPRLGELAVICHSLNGGPLVKLLSCIDESQSERLFHQWSGTGIEQQFQTDILVSAERLLTAGQRLPATQPEAAQSTATLSQETVRYFLYCLATLEPPQDMEATLWAAAHRVFLHRYGARIPALLAVADKTQPWADRVLGPETNAAKIAADLLVWTEAAPAKRRYIEALLDSSRAQAAAVIDSKVIETTHRPAKAPTSDGQVLYSHNAGLALLVPVIISLGLYRHYSSTQLCQALIWASGETDVQLTEPWLQKLFHTDDNSVLVSGSNALPHTWRLGLDETRQRHIESLEGAEQLAQLLLYQFAARLSGLQQSSNSYLRRQFFQHSGRFVFASDLIEAHISGLPLAIVLRMSGLSRWSDRLPWMNCRFSIMVAE